MGKHVIIGVGGYKGHGKDTFTSQLAQWLRVQQARRLYKFGVRVDSFAKPLYDGAHAITGIDFKQLSRSDKERLCIIEGNPLSTPRNIMQTLGTEWARDMIDANFWVEMLRRRASAYEGINAITIVSDVRFPNELEFIKDRESGDETLTYWVDATQRVGASEDAHASENEVGPDDFDMVISNNKTGNDLHDIAEIISMDILRRCSH